MGKTACPGCAVELDADGEVLDERYNATSVCRKLFDELSAFTLSLRDDDFIHQLVVDSYAGQHSGPRMKPIGITFALIGLYLSFERGYTGKQVQRAHVLLGKTRRQWPRFYPPKGTGSVTVLDVITNLSHENYRKKITGWGKSVWSLWQPQHDRVDRLVTEYLKS